MVLAMAIKEIHPKVQISCLESTSIKNKILLYSQMLVASINLYISLIHLASQKKPMSMLIDLAGFACLN